MIFKRIMFQKLITAAAFCAVASVANAITFQGDFGVNYNNSDPGLVVNVNPSNGSFGPFDLDVGEHQVFHIFNLWTNERAINPDDTVEKPISVDFSFNTPSTSGTLNGSTDGKLAFFGVFQWGQMSWDNPLVLNFGKNGSGEIQISLFGKDGPKFNKGIFGTHPGERYGANVYAKVKYTTAAIPLPAGLPLLLAGLGGFGLLARRKGKTA